MQAIQVKLLPATDTQPVRLKAWSFSGESITRPLNQEYEAYDDSANIAWELAKELKWKGEFRGGTLPNGDMVWVMGTSYFFRVIDTSKGELSSNK